MTTEWLAMLGRSSLAATIAVAMVLGLRGLIRRHLGARSAYRLWLLVPSAAVAVLLPPPNHPLDLSIQQAVLSAAAPTDAVASTIENLSPTFEWSAGLLLVWIAGMAITLALFVLQQRRYLHQLGELSRVGDGRLKAASNVGSPALVGVLRPRIVVPADFESRYTSHERELVLAHERVHLCGGDAQINALVVLVRCAQWFNPLVHFAASRLRFDQELACDALVMSNFPAARRAYANAMLKAQLGEDSPNELCMPAGCYWPARHPLRERIALLKQPSPGAGRRRTASCLIALLTFVTAYTAWAAQAPRVTDESSEPLFQIDGDFYAGDQQILHGIALRGAEKWPLITSTGDTPESSWTLRFTINAAQSDLKKVDLKIEHLNTATTFRGSIVALNQTMELATTAVFVAGSSGMEAAVPLVFRGTIKPVDLAAMCKEMIRERQTQTLHAFDVKLPSNQMSIGGGQSQIRGDRMHMLAPEPQPIEFALVRDGYRIDPVKIRATSADEQRTRLEIERFHDKLSLGTEIKTVAFGEEVAIDMQNETVYFVVQPVLAEDRVPLGCRNASVATARIR